MADSSLMRILRLIICSRPQSNSTSNSGAMIIINHIITLASLMSAIAGLYLLPGSPLRSLLPSARSAVLVSLPHLWRSLLSWTTPPCLFVILNCIIITLTLTSDSFKGPSSARSGLYTNLVTKMEAVHRHMDNSPPPKACKRPAVVPLQAIACRKLEKEEPVAVQDKRKENDYFDNDDPLAMAAASDPAQTRDWHSQPASPSQEQATKCVRRAKSIDSSSMHVLYSTNRKHANRHAASASYTSSASSSATTSSCSSSSSYTLSTPSSPSSPSSPCSADYDGYSAPRQFDPSHGDELSDDDLRKRIEAFISKMNAQMRREAATSSME